MLRKRYYILFVARDEDGRVRKIPLPLRYVYGFVAAALVGAFTIVGLAGSYTRMLLKTESFNQVRQDNAESPQRLQADGPNRARSRCAGGLARRAGQRSDRSLRPAPKQGDCRQKPRCQRGSGTHATTLAANDDVSQQDVKMISRSVLCFARPGHVRPRHART